MTLWTLATIIDGRLTAIGIFATEEDAREWHREFMAPEMPAGKKFLPVELMLTDKMTQAIEQDGIMTWHRYYDMLQSVPRELHSC